MAKGHILEADVRFEWYKTASMIIYDLGFGPELNKAAAEILYENYAEFVPWSLQESSGNLANNIRIQNVRDGAIITHLVPYAHRQWDADEGNPYGVDDKVHRTRAPQLHPKATSHWEKWAWQQKKDKIVREIDKERIKYSRQRRMNGQ